MPETLSDRLSREHPIADFSDWMDAHHPELMVDGVSWVPIEDGPLFTPPVEAAIVEYERWCENEERAWRENLALDLACR